MESGIAERKIEKDNIMTTCQRQFENRRNFIKLAGLSAASLVVSGSEGVVGVRAVAERPNILLLVSEDGGPDLGCYGNPYCKTPNLDALAKKGIRFTNAYVTQAGCSPSRASFLTGTYPHENGQIGLATHKYHMYKKNTPNIVRSLKEAGYRTGRLGKLHVNPESAFPFDYHKSASRHRRDVKQTAEYSREFITQSDEPFFLMISYADTHVGRIQKSPDAFPKQAKGLPKNPLTAKDVKALPALGVDSPLIRATTANYYNCYSRLDTGIGMVLDYLKKAGKGENTLIIYLSDHGPQMSRGKMTNYDFGTRIPLIIYDPQLSKPSVNDKLVSTIDLMPTILDRAGLPCPDHLNGKSLMPFVKGRSAEWRAHLFTEYHVHWPETFFPARSVRDKRYKLTVNLLQNQTNPLYYQYIGDCYQWDVLEGDLKKASPKIQKAYETFKSPPPLELYDLENDPYEFVNLIDHPELKPVVDRLLDQMKKWQEETDDPLQHPEMLSRLKKENDATMPDGKYRNVARRKGFKWRYPEYFKETK